jgi:trans-2,3-dihydro-3-hydroxyanthranilate isomerase
MAMMPYYHVDVFSDKLFSGNGLTIFPESQGLSKERMQTLTREMRQFESIFLRRVTDKTYDANVFTMEEELVFAGHPSLGAAALLHELYEPEEDAGDWVLRFPSKEIPVHTQRRPFGYQATMNQGPAVFGPVLSGEQRKDFLLALNLGEQDVSTTYPLQVVSTGLPYLLIPVVSGFEQARICVTDLGERLSSIRAQFIGVLDVHTLSIRTWDNLGQVEDIATGSLAGPSGAYLVNYGVCSKNEEILVQQGKNLGRPSKLLTQVLASGDVYVTGDVVMVASGHIAHGITA